MARRTSRPPDPRLIDARNRVSLPRQVLRTLDVAAGDFVTFTVDEHGVVRLLKLSILVAAPRRPGSSRTDG